MITSPASGSTLRGSIQVFVWDLEGLTVENNVIENAFLYVGSTRGGTQYGARRIAVSNAASSEPANETSIGRLPSDGSTVHVRLWYRSGGVWRFFDEEYTAASAENLPAFTDPPPDGSLVGTTQTFRWNFNDLPVTGSWLYVGDTIGGSDYAARPTGTDTSATVAGLPTDQRTVHARLYFQVARVWYNVDGSYASVSVVPPTRDELTRELQRLVGTTPDGIVGPLTRAALNRNWLGRPDGFDPSFAERFVNDADLVRWVQRRINTRAATSLELNGTYDRTTERAVVAHLDRSGVVAAESYVALLDS